MAKGKNNYTSIHDKVQYLNTEGLGKTRLLWPNAWAPSLNSNNPASPAILDRQALHDNVCKLLPQPRYEKVGDCGQQCQTFLVSTAPVSL